MSGVRISALPPAPSAGLADIFPAVHAGVTSKESLSQVMTLFQQKLVTPDDGGILFSDASQIQLLASTPTANQMLQSGASSSPNWSVTSWPATSMANSLLWSPNDNVIDGLPSLSNSVLTTDASGIPSWVPVTGTGAVVLSNSPSLLAPSLGFASALTLSFNPTTGGIVGTTLANNVLPGIVGEYVSSNVPAGMIPLVTATPKTVTSISLSAGDYDITANASFTIGGVCTAVVAAISAVANTLPGNLSNHARISNAAVNNTSMTTPAIRLNVAAPTIVYLVAQAAFSSSTVTTGGNISARRVR